MQAQITLHRYIKLFLIQLCLVSLGFSQGVTSDSIPDFDSQLLRLKVPEAFQRNHLQMEVYADSSWQIYRGVAALNFVEAMNLLGQSHIVREYQEHLDLEAQYTKDYRSRRVFSVVTSVGGASYLIFSWSKGWVYQIPGFAALLVAGGRYRDSKKLESQALREQYFQQSLASPASMQKLVDDYNFRLYQYLTQAGIQFSED